MQSYGEYLRSLREEKNKSLEEISEKTKIALANLESLEKDRYDLLPPRVFVKGFIRSYLLELGLDPKEGLQKFEDYSKSGEVPNFLEDEHPVFPKPPTNREYRKSNIFTGVLTFAGLVSFVILALTGVTKIFFDGSQQAQSPADITSTSSKSVAQAQKQPSGSFDQAAKAQSGKRSLEIRALANTWLRIEPDGGPAEEVFMAPGDIQIFTARDSFSVQTGNAGGIRLKFDGRELPPLGKINQSLSLTLP